MIRFASLLKRRDRGAVAVEFAIIAPLFLLMLLAAIDFGRAYYVKAALLNGAGQAARLVALGETRTATLETAARNAAPGAQDIAYSSSPIALTFSPTSGACVGTASATTSLNFSWVTPLQWLPRNGASGSDSLLTATVQWKCVNN